MTSNEVLDERSKTQGIEVKKLFTSNQKRKHDITNLQKENLGVVAAVEEQNVKLDHIADTMDKIVIRLEKLESKSFDWSKFLSGLSKPYVLYPILLTVLGVTITIFAPESLSEFLGLADKIPGVK